MYFNPVDKKVFCDANQFTYGGNASCTYCSIEAVIYFLHGMVQIDSNSEVPDAIVRSGVSLDLKIGFTSCDECYQKVERFQEQLILGNILQSSIRNDAFMKIIDRMVSDSNMKDRVAYVLTKPPETIAIMYDPKSTFPFVIYDSHPRTQNRKKSGFIFYANKNHLFRHLTDLFNVNSFYHDDLSEYSKFEATRLFLKEKISFQLAEEFLQKQQWKNKSKMRNETASLNINNLDVNLMDTIRQLKAKVDDQAMELKDLKKSHWEKDQRIETLRMQLEESQKKLNIISSVMKDE